MIPVVDMRRACPHAIANVQIATIFELPAVRTCPRAAFSAFVAALQWQRRGVLEAGGVS